LGPFVNSVCNHVLFEHYRSQKRTEATIDDEVEATIAGRKPSALSLLEAKDSERVVRQILNQLPERDRRLLQSVLLEERNKDEVCAEFGITREYLRVLLHRAKQSFKSCYTSRLGQRGGSVDVVQRGSALRRGNAERDIRFGGVAEKLDYQCLAPVSGGRRDGIQTDGDSSVHPHRAAAG
jgi:hypothetical protein